MSRTPYHREPARTHIRLEGQDRTLCGIGGKRFIVTTATPTKSDFLCGTCQHSYVLKGGILGPYVKRVRPTPSP